MQSLHNILNSLVKDYGIEGGITLNKVRSRWVELVGEPVSVHTFPDTIKGRTLTIIVDTPQWMHHLSFFKDEISSKLNPFGIMTVHFRMGKIPLRSDKEKKIAHAELSDTDLQYIENTVGDLKDEELKDTFRKLIKHGLSLKKTKGQ